MLVDQRLQSRIGHVVLVPLFFFCRALAFARCAVQRQLRYFELGQELQFFGDLMKRLNRRIDSNQPAIHLALQNNLGDFAHIHFRRNRRAHAVFEQRLRFGHGVLADQHQQPRARIQRGPLPQPLDLVIQPRAGKVLIDGVALREAFFECFSLQFDAGVIRFCAILGAQFFGHGDSLKTRKNNFNPAWAYSIFNRYSIFNANRFSTLWRARSCRTCRFRF